MLNGKPNPLPGGGDLAPCHVECFGRDLRRADGPMIGVPDWRYSRGEGAVKINRLPLRRFYTPPGPVASPLLPRRGSKTLMARDPIKLTIQGDDDDGLRFETVAGGNAHPLWWGLPS